MNVLRYAFFALTIILLLATPNVGNAENNPDHIAQLRDELARQELWPGYDPSTIPLAIFVRDTTWLYNFPGTPEGFQASNEPKNSWMAGQHSTIVANSSGMIDSVIVSTLLIDGGLEHSDAEWASISLHEGFHVFQQQHTNWSTNEADLFLYPFESSDIYANRLLETWALSQALGSEGEDRAQWAATVLELRRKRYEALPTAGQRYECAVELVEGSAYYVESKARTNAGVPIEQDELLNPNGYSLSDIRPRGYHTGIALALLLDDFLPEWKSNISQPCDALEVQWTPFYLLLASCEMIQQAGPMPIDEARKERAVAQAVEECEVYQQNQKLIRENYRARDGWALEIEAEAKQPLFLRGFDPMNVFRLGEGEVLNKRYIALGNDQAELQVLNQRALTITRDGIPLFSGVQKVLITGLEEEPASEEIQGVTRYSFDGGQLVVRNADVMTEGKKLHIRLHE